MAYPAYASRGDLEDLKSKAEAVVEHKSVEEVVLSRLMAADVGSREFARTSKVLMEFVAHHAEEEEKTIVPAIEAAFRAERIGAIGR